MANKGNQEFAFMYFGEAMCILYGYISLSIMKSIPCKIATVSQLGESMIFHQNAMHIKYMIIITTLLFQIVSAIYAVFFPLDFIIVW